MKHFGVSKLSKHLVWSTWPQSREKRGTGATGPLKHVHAAFGGPGVMSPSAPWPDRAFQFLGEAAQAGKARPLPDPSPTEACPAQPAGSGALGSVWLCPFHLVMANKGQAP